MKTKIIVVDENDNIIGYKDRELITQSDIYRVSALWITNGKGDILLAQRAFTKSHNPGKWGPAVAGTVEEGESYLENIIKEAKEEIGLENINPKIGPKIRKTGEYNYFGQWFLLKIDKSIDEFVIDKNEVEQLKWLSKDKLLNEVENFPDKFLKNIRQNIEMFCS